MARRGKSAAFLRNLRRRYRLGEFAGKRTSGRRATVRRRASGARASGTRRRSSKRSSAGSSFNPNMPSSPALQRLTNRPSLELTRAEPANTLESSGIDVPGGRYQS